LFIDARKIGSMISRTQKELNADDIAAIAKTYHAWKHLPSTSGRGAGGEGTGEKSSEDNGYTDIPGYCKSVTIEEIKSHQYVLTLGRYVGAAPLEDDGTSFETKMTEMSQTLYALMEESAKLDDVIRKNLEGLGYGE
jgi:type I restriction enzyme M protein